MGNWNWTRKDFGNPGGIPKDRANAERETTQDLQKPIQQLICDVREEAMGTGSDSEKLLRMGTRMVSMMGRVALEQESATKKLLYLTWAVVALTSVLVLLTVAIIL